MLHAVYLYRVADARYTTRQQRIDVVDAVLLREVLVPLPQDDAAKEGMRLRIDQARMALQGCTQATEDTLLRDFPGTQITWLGWVQATDLDPTARPVIVQTPLAHATPLMVGQAIVRFYMVCARKTHTQTNAARGETQAQTDQDPMSKEAIERALLKHKLGLAVDDYTRALRAKAFVHYKDMR
jgi:hypothetical protein